MAIPKYDKDYIIIDMVGNDTVIHYACGYTRAMDLCHAYNQHYPNNRYTIKELTNV